MTFDWFRRRHDNEEPKLAAPVEVQPDQPDADAETVAAPDDQLKWAKIAYENIRKRQQEAAQAAADAAIAEPAEVAIDSSEIAQPDGDRPDPVESTTAEAELISEPEPVDAIAEAEPVTKVDTPQLSAPILAETTPEPATPLPFWAAAEADRQ